MVDDSDWRLRGQERYLQGVTLVRRRYRAYAKNPSWGHDHCAFCWAKFMVEDCADVVHEGYATTDDYWWICQICFDDFKQRFSWSLAESDDPRDA